MPRICTICAHLDRDSIEAELLAGKPFREIAGRFRTSPAALFRHRHAHLPDRLLKAREAVEVSKADTLIQQIEDLQITAQQILKKAESDGDLRTALAGVKELSRLIEMVAKMTRELRSKQSSDVTVPLVDNPTARKMAELFLERQSKKLP